MLCSTRLFLSPIITDRIIVQQVAKTLPIVTALEIPDFTLQHSLFCSVQGLVRRKRRQALFFRRFYSSLHVYLLLKGGHEFLL